MIAGKEELASMSRAEREQIRKRLFQRNASRNAQECGPPDLTKEQISAGKKKKRKYKNNLLGFLQDKDLFGHSTAMKPYGNSQKQAIRMDQHVLLHGGKVNKLMFRAAAKTSSTIGACLWGTLYGHTRFIPVFTAGKERSEEIVEGWQVELLTNDWLFYMFPDLVWPMRHLEGSPLRARGQTYNGNKTFIKWKMGKLVFPTVLDPKSGDPIAGSGAVLVAKPWKSARGTYHQMPNGERLRPTLAVIDDIQRDEDAESQTTVRKMMRTIDKSIGFLGGHDSVMAIINNATPIEPDDVPSQLAQRKDWKTVRFPMMLERSKNEDLWLTDYATILQDYIKGDEESEAEAQQKAKKFYVKNRKKMDAGCKPAWKWAFPWRHNEKHPDKAWCISATQNFYNHLIANEESAMSELQVSPIVDEEAKANIATFEILKEKQHKHLKRLQVPQFGTHLVAHIDVQKSVLFYGILAVSQDFEGMLIDWGALPRQKRMRYSLKQLNPTIQDVYPGGSETQQLYSAVRDGIKAIAEQEYVREDGTGMDMGRIGVDARWQPRTIRKACRDSQYKNLCLPMMGQFYDENDVPISAREPKEGEIVGIEWRQKVEAGRLEVIFDTNFWKSLTHNLFCAPPGAGESWSVTNTPVAKLRQLSDHVESEYPKRKEGHPRTGGSRSVDIWKMKVGRKRNDHLDNAVGCAVLASIMGCRCADHEMPTAAKAGKKIVVRRRRRRRT